MKVLFVINSSNNGGAQKMIITLYNGMLKIFPNSKIVFLRKINSQYSNIEDAYYLSDRLSTSSDYIKVYKKLRNLIKKEAPDVTISFLPLANILTSFIGRKMQVKTRIASQRNPPQTYGVIVKAVDRILGRLGYYTHNVCNSQAGMDAFSGYSNSYKDKLSVIMNCVESADLNISKEEAKRTLGITTTKKIITCVGRLHEQKNHKLLVDMMRHIDDAVLYCAGDGPLRNEITIQINKNNVADKIVLLGDLDRSQVRMMLRSTDVFVIPSKYEGLSNSLIEALAYGLPVVFSNIPSFTKFLKQDDETYAGVLVKSNDDKLWAEKIAGLMNDQKQMELYKNLSFSKVADLTSENMTLKFKSLFNIGE